MEIDKKNKRNGATGTTATRGASGKRCPACGSESIRTFPMVGISLVRYVCNSCGKSYLTSR